MKRTEGARVTSLARVLASREWRASSGPRASPRECEGGSIRSTAQANASMIPYLPQPTLHLGPLTLHAFGVLVALAVIVGGAMGRRHARKLGVADALIVNLLTWTVVPPGGGCVRHRRARAREGTP